MDEREAVVELRAEELLDRFGLRVVLGKELVEQLVDPGFVVHQLAPPEADATAASGKRITGRIEQSPSTSNTRLMRPLTRCAPAQHASSTSSSSVKCSWSRPQNAGVLAHRDVVERESLGELHRQPLAVAETRPYGIADVLVHLFGDTVFVEAPDDVTRRPERLADTAVVDLRDPHPHDLEFTRRERGRVVRGVAELRSRTAERLRPFRPEEDHRVAISGDVNVRHTSLLHTSLADCGAGYLRH